MKTLQKIAKKHGLQLVPVNYYYSGIKLKRKGFDLIDYSRTIYLSFEPYHSNDGTKWIMKSYAKSNPFFSYLKSIKDATKLLAQGEFMPTGHTGYRLK